MTPWWISAATVLYVALITAAVLLAGLGWWRRSRAAEDAERKRWEAMLPPVHPHCRCIIPPVPDYPRHHRQLTGMDYAAKVISEEAALLEAEIKRRLLDGATPADLIIETEQFGAYTRLRDTRTGELVDFRRDTPTRDNVNRVLEELERIMPDEE